MSEKDEYDQIKVEGYKPHITSGLHGEVHIRPLPGQTPYEPDMHVECAKELSSEYPVGTKFIIKAKITSRQGGKPFVYSRYSWAYTVLK